MGYKGLVKIMISGSGMGGGGYSPNFRVGVCRQDLKSLILAVPDQEKF